MACFSSPGLHRSTFFTKREEKREGKGGKKGTQAKNCMLRIKSSNPIGRSFFQLGEEGAEGDNIQAKKGAVKIKY